MANEEDNILNTINQTLLYLIDGEINSAIDLLDKTEPTLISKTHCTEIFISLRKFIIQYQNASVFLHALSIGNLEVNPPDDPLHENYVIAQYKQLHSNMCHFAWQVQQIAKGDLNQKVNFLGEFSIAFNKMTEALREKKLMEEKIQLQNEQLQKLNSEKDKLFMIISHDLRSPFNSFLGLTQIMAEELNTMTHEEIKNIVITLSKSATNLYSLLENLLEWSLMQRGMRRFKPESFILLNTITTIIELARDAADKKMIKISYDIPENMIVLADIQMIESLMRNLVFNAIKFTHKNGNITIAAKPILDNFVEVSIKDTGIGMKKNMIDNLFHIDKQTNRKGTEGEPSTGLGLILCKDIIEKHCGKFWIESEEGIGSTFHFTIPHNAETEAKPDILNIGS